MDESRRIKKSFRIALGAIVAVELGIAFFLGYGIYTRYRLNKNILGAATVISIRKEYLISSPSAELKYFYEPPPSVTQTDHPDWLPYVATYTINADTLNAPYNYSVQKPPGTFRIVTLGDSFTFGHFVNTQDNWSEQIERILNQHCTTPTIKKIEVINLGERGYDVKYAAHRLLLRGMKYKPDLIIYFESGAGFSRINELWEPLIEKYTKEITPEETELAKKDGFYYLPENEAEAEVNQKYSPLQIFEEIHQAWSELFSIRGNTNVIIATFNNIGVINMTKLKLWTLGYSNVSVFTGVRDIYSLNGALPDRHPNVTGHQIIASDIYKYLKDDRFIQCQ